MNHIERKINQYGLTLSYGSPDYEALQPANVLSYHEKSGLGFSAKTVAISAKQQIRSKQPQFRKLHPENPVNPF